MKNFLTKALLVLLMTLPAVAFAQVTGAVYDKNTGDPLIGVSVAVKGKSAGTMTDIDGNFSINANAKDVLVFSYVGYTKAEYNATPGKKMNILMADNAIEMEEVVVVGVAMKKSDLTGAVQHVSAQDIKNVPTADVNQALQGKVPGVYVKSSPRPGETASIKVRGNNSISYGTNPIYVVDGLVMDGGFDALNPNDIESIDVLKDASATAIYGARGANGVIVITTKKGKSKEGKLSYNGWVGFQDFTKKIPTL
ncbi:MAG: TonB-dependent receptor plug domain-containing protein, partial [Bacteroidaceae bacterium]|nr:TonB-dependent receptor plug domain-containing protein [Bacteroidaceae bacterium]